MQIRFLLLILLIVLFCVPANPQHGIGMNRGTFFDPFPIGASWTMKDALTGYQTNFQVSALAAQTSFSCFTPAYSSLMVDIHIAKTAAAAYPNPGLPNNEDLYIFKSAAWGPYIFMQISSNMLNTNPIATTYFFRAFANPPYGMMLIDEYTFWGQQQDSGSTNTCHSPPGSTTNTWSTTISQGNRTTPVYTGPVICATYTSVSTTQNQEEWCFASNPRFPPILVEMDAITEAGNPSNIKLQTLTIGAF